MRPLITNATYADLCRVDDRFIAEIVDGELYASPRPPIRHVHAASVLAAQLGSLLDWPSNGPGGWIMLNKPELHFGGDVLVPDITAWSRDRLPALPNAAFMTLAPDWICEVLSPATETLDRSRKLPVYARERVEHAWLLDPVRNTLEVLALRTGTWEPLIEHEGGGKVRAPPFDAVEIDLDALWI